MKIVFKDKKKKKGIFENIILKKLIMKLSRFALLAIFIQILSIPFIIKYNKATIKYILGISSKKDLYIKSEFYNSKFKDFSGYLKDIYNASFTNKKLNKLYLNISLKDASIIDCKINKDCIEGIDNSAKGELILNKKKYKVKLSPKGMRKIHNLDFKRMSFKVNVKGQKKFQGMDNFSIQMPVIRGYDSELLVSNLLRKDNLLAPKNIYFKFYLNGEYVGIRHIEESVRKELIESANYRYGPIFDLDQRDGDIYHLGSFNLIEDKKWSKRDNKIANNGLIILNRSKNNPSLFNSYFNQKKWAKYFAYMQAFQTFHGTLPKSIKFYLNPIESKFEPIFFDGHLDKWNKNTRITDLIFKYSTEEECKNGMLGSNHGVYLCNQIKWYEFLFGDSFQNKKFYIEYLNSLEKISSPNFINTNLRNEWDKLSFYRGSLYKEFWRIDEYYQFGLTPYIASWSSLESRLKKIRDEVFIAKNVQPSFKYDAEKRKINILNKKSILPQIAYVFCGSKSSSPLILIQDKTKKYDLNLLGNCNSKNVYLSLHNQKRKTLLSNSRNIFKNINSLNNQQNSKESKINKFYLSSNKILNIKNDQVITSDNIHFSPGSKICLSNKATLVLESKNILFDSSTRSGGVKIEGCDESGGSLIIRNSNVIAKEIYSDNLISPSNYLTEFYGGINVINSKFLFNNLSINNSKSEDAINFIDSQVKGKAIYLKNINSDAIDLDNSTMKVDSIVCEDIGNDCIDFSSSIGKIENIQSINIKDKVISLGEESNLNIKFLNIKSSEIGAVSKDNSVLFISKFDYSDVKLPIVSFIKKSQFNSSIVKILEIFPRSFEDYLISPESIVIVGGKSLKSNQSSKDIKKIIYGNQFGVKTIR